MKFKIFPLNFSKFTGGKIHFCPWKEIKKGNWNLLIKLILFGYGFNFGKLVMEKFYTCLEFNSVKHLKNGNL